MIRQIFKASKTLSEAETSSKENLADPESKKILIEDVENL